MPNLPLVHILEAVQKRQLIHNVADLSDSAKSDDIAVQGVANLANAKPTDLSFIADKKYLDALKQTQAGVVLVGSKFADAVPEHCIAVIVDSPYLAYASVSPLFEDNAGQALEKQANDIHSTAVIGNQVTLGEGVSIGAYCVLGDNVTIGDNTILQSHITLGNDVSIGANCVIKPQVTIAHDCVVGDGDADSFPNQHRHGRLRFCPNCQSRNRRMGTYRTTWTSRDWQLGSHRSKCVY